MPFRICIFQKAKAIKYHKFILIIYYFISNPNAKFAILKFLPSKVSRWILSNHSIKLVVRQFMMKIMTPHPTGRLSN